MRRREGEDTEAVRQQTAVREKKRRRRHSGRQAGKSTCMAYTALCRQCARADCLSTDLLHDVSPGLEAEQLEPMLASTTLTWPIQVLLYGREEQRKVANDGSAVRMRCLTDSLTACRG